MTLFKTAVGNFEAKNYQECANLVVEYLGLIGSPLLIECWACMAFFTIETNESLSAVNALIDGNEFYVHENKPYLPEYAVSHKFSIGFSVTW